MYEATCPDWPLFVSVGRTADATPPFLGRPQLLCTLSHRFLQFILVDLELVLRRHLVARHWRKIDRCEYIPY